VTSAWPERQHGRAATRPALVALAGFSMVTGVGLILSVAPTAWATDAHRNLLAARALLDGTFGTADGYLYSPLAAALTIPALAVPEGAAVVGWLLLKVFILLIATRVATRGLQPLDRLLASVAVIAFLPVLYDLELGNVTILVAASIAMVAWIPDRAAAGIPLGIVLTTVPKPQLIPVLIWMAVFRRRALGGALGAAGLGTLAGLFVLGPGPYGEWIAALRAPPDLTAGNFSLSGMPPLAAIPVSLAVVAATLLALRRGPAPGLVAALACGLLVSPYTILYAAGVLLVAAPALARAAPRPTLVLALLAPVGLVVAFPLWVGSVMLLAFTVPRGRWPGGCLTPVPAGSIERAGPVDSPP
jgi:hypothetical protein